MKNRVLIEVRGGVARLQHDDEVNVYLVDYDDEPDAEVPNDFKNVDGNFFTINARKAKP